MKFYPLGTLGIETSFLLTSWQSLEGSKDWPSNFCVPKGLLETAARSLQTAEAVFSLLYWHRLQSRGLSTSTPAVTLTCLSNQLQQQRIWHSCVTGRASWLVLGSCCVTQMKNHQRKTKICCVLITSVVILSSSWVCQHEQRLYFTLQLTRTWHYRISRKEAFFDWFLKHKSGWCF